MSLSVCPGPVREFNGNKSPSSGPLSIPLVTGGRQTSRREQRYLCNCNAPLFRAAVTRARALSRFLGDREREREGGGGGGERSAGGETLTVRFNEIRACIGNVYAEEIRSAPARLKVVASDDSSSIIANARQVPCIRLSRFL